MPTNKSFSPSFKNQIRRVASREPPLKDTRVPTLLTNLDQSKLEYEKDALKQKLQETKDTHTLRMRFSFGIFGLVSVWLLFVVGAVFIAGWNWHGFVLSDKVLIVFITSTTFNVVGLFAIVAKWMFPSNSSNDSKK